MFNFIYFYQHVPYYLNPAIFSIGFFSLDWYSLMYLIGFFVVYLLLKYRISHNEFHFKTDAFLITRNQKNSHNLLLDFLLHVFIGLIIGARLGYVLFYNLSYYWNNPLAIISPFDPTTHKLIGIYGMSYHGGLLGVLIAAWIFTKIYRINFWKLANFVAPAVPAGYFFGRIGNFMNGELWGRVTHVTWGMYFPADPTSQLRHPSQLYEDALEGLLLFLLLWTVRNHKRVRGQLIGWYILGYAAFRILVEFFRQPDEQIGYIWNFLTMGQLLSFFMLMAGLILIFYLRRKSKKML